MVGTSSVRKAAMPRDDPGRKNYSEAMRTGRKAGGLFRGVDEGVALAAPRGKANALTDRGMRGGGRGEALACLELWNCDGLQKSTGGVREGESCSRECRLRLGFRMGWLRLETKTGGRQMLTDSAVRCLLGIATRCGLSTSTVLRRAVWDVSVDLTSERSILEATLLSAEWR